MQTSSVRHSVVRNGFWFVILLAKWQFDGGGVVVEDVVVEDVVVEDVEVEDVVVEYVVVKDVVVECDAVVIGVVV